MLLASDARLFPVHSYHRAQTLITSAGDLAVHMSRLEDDYAKRASLVDSLEEKLAQCKIGKDKLGQSFWGDRVNEKRKGLKELEKELEACKAEFASMNAELDDGVGSGITLRAHADVEEKDEVLRIQQTHEELDVWKACNETSPNARPFPPLEDVLRAPPCGRFGQGHYGGHGRRHHGRFGPYGPLPHHGPPGLRSFIERVHETVQNPASPNSLVPANEIKSMLDNFLANLSTQLAGTFNDGQRTEQTSEPRVPGAFVNAETQTSPPPPVAPPAPASAKPERPSSKLGKGGFRHKHISCDGCLTGIRGMRYKCEVGLAGHLRCKLLLTLE